MGVIRGMGSYYFESGILPKSTFSVQVGISHDDENGIGIWQQRITALEQVEITLLSTMATTICLEWFQTTL